MERCGICGAYEITEDQNGSLRCQKCGAIFYSEKEYQKALSKLTAKEQKEFAKRDAAEREEKRKKEEQDRINSAIPYVTITFNDREKLKVVKKKIVLCQPVNNKVVVQIKGKKRITSNVTVKPVKFLQSVYTYKPSKTVYTGASSGGISMGGLHETKAGYIEDLRDTGHYFVSLKIDDEKPILIEKVEFSDDISAIVYNQTGLPKSFSVVENPKAMEESKRKAHLEAIELSLDVYNTQSHIEGRIASFYPYKAQAELICSAINIALFTKPAEVIYEEAMKLYNEDDILKNEETIAKLKKINPYKDSAQIIEKYEKACAQKKAEEERIKQKEDEKKYERALNCISSGSISELNEAVELFKELGNYKDSQIRLKGAENNLKNIAAKKTKKVLTIGIPLVVVIVCAFMLYTLVVLPSMTYNKGLSLMESGKYEEAIAKFESLNGKRDSTNLVTECKYLDAMSLMESKKYEEAIEKFESLDGERDSASLITECKYLEATSLMESKKYEEAIELYNELSTYKNSEELKKKCVESINNTKYDKAVKLMNEADYVEAFNIFEDLGDFKKAEEYSKKIVKKAYRQILDSTPIGSTFCLGYYEQDGDTSDGKEKIEWMVLDKKGNKYFVISKYGLAERKFNNKTGKVTWDGSTIRRWLNNDFYQKAFTAANKKIIETSTVTADRNPSRDTSQGSSTSDRIFLLSISEVEKYMESEDMILCMLSKYQYKGSENFDSWVLRTMGGRYGANNEYYNVTDVGKDGSISFEGAAVSFDYLIRPAMWINVE